MLLIIMSWTKESLIRSINQTVVVILLSTKILFVNSGSELLCLKRKALLLLFLLLILTVLPFTIKPISIEDLALDPDLLPPKLCKLCGQPKTKRVRKTA